MMLRVTPRFLKSAVLYASIVGVCATGLSACNGVPLPPIPLSISLVSNGQIAAADVTNGTIQVPVSIFCNLFDPQQLNNLLVAAGGQAIANLVSIPSVTLDSITVEATSGDFNAFTSASLKLVGTNPLDLGAASNASGLGTSFDMTQATPVDLINDLAQGDCGVPTLTLQGSSAPTSDITYNVTANVSVYTQLNLK